MVARKATGEIVTQEVAAMPPVQTPSQADALVILIERVAMNPDLPIERLQQVLDMKERMEDRAREDQARQAERDYFAAMASCQKALPVVIKDKSNSHTKSRYADLAAIERYAMPVIHDHGFSVSFQPDGTTADALRIKWEVGHAGGYSKSGVSEIPLDGKGLKGNDNKTAVQTFGSTATYGRRYLLCMLFNISTGDDNDGNAPQQQAPDRINPEQFITLRDLLEKSGMPEPMFHSAMGARKPEEAILEEFPASLFDAAIARLENYIAKKTEREQTK